jgi:predicted NBD/HSP70 family sugar kinase
MTTQIPDGAGRPWSRQVLRSNNERVLLERLRAAGTASRAELARVTGISKPTVSTALGHLERAGLVRETGELVTSGRGRSAVLYEVDPTAGYVVGIDVGRSWIRVAVADLDGVIAGRSEVPNTARDAEEMVPAATAIAHEVVRAAGLEWYQVVHTVVGSPGVIDPVSGEVRYAGNLPGWGRPGLVERMQASLGTALTVHNDANLAALGEHVFGAGQGCPLFVYLMVGTGVGAGVVVDGRLFPGAHGAAGEVGYLPFAPGLGGAADRLAEGADVGVDGDASRSRFAGGRGMLEDAVGGDAVVAEAIELGLTRPVSASGVAAGAETGTTTRSGAGSGRLGAKEVFDAARAGDPIALAAVRVEAARLAQAVAAVAAVLDPALIVLGGGIGGNSDLLLGPVREALAELTPLRPELAASTLGRDAVLMGAIATALTTAREFVFESRSAEPEQHVLLDPGRRAAGREAISLEM